MKTTIFRSFLSAAILFGFSLPATAQSVAVTSWNIEWLSSNPSPSVTESQRDEEDFKQLANHFRQFTPGILAFQEVNDYGAINRVVGDDYQLVMSDRSESGNGRFQFSDINQYTGFAIKRGIPFTNVKDVRLDKGQSSKLRFATYVILYPDSNRPVHALSVHLKAGCSGAYQNERECRILNSQAKALNTWILDRTRTGQPYLIMGDFNHNLPYQGDWFWSTLVKGLDDEPTLTTRYTKAECKVRSNKDPKRTHQFRSLIDHIIASPDFDAGPAKQNTFSSEDVLKFKLSDHCPVSTQLKW